MSAHWFRLWSDLPTDPKFRVIARASGQNTGHVISVYISMLNNASLAEERGVMHHFVPEDIAMANDIETAQVDAIFLAMQGRLLDGDRVMGWEKRQPIREDGSAERAKAWREAKKTTSHALKAAGTAAKATTPTVPSVVVPAPESAPVAAPGVDADTPAGKVAADLVAHGITPDPTSTAITDLLAMGASVADFAEATKMGKERGKAFAYVMGIVRNQRAWQPASASTTTPPAHAVDPTLAKIIADGLIPRSGPSAEIRAKMAAMTRRPAAKAQAKTQAAEEVCCA